MFLIIGYYGSRERRIRSAYLLFLYTLSAALNIPLVSSINYLKGLSRTHATKWILACSPPLKKL